MSAGADWKMSAGEPPERQAQEKAPRGLSAGGLSSIAAGYIGRSAIQAIFSFDHLKLNDPHRFKISPSS
jgi:hypothetical protein